MRQARVEGQSGSPSKSSRAASHRAPCRAGPGQRRDWWGSDVCGLGKSTDARKTRLVGEEGAHR